MQQLQEPTARDRLVARGKRLAYLTVGWNTIEGIAASAAGLLAGSVALVGFGFDSGIETISGFVMIWRLHSDFDEEKREQIEQKSLRLVGLSFLVLAAYVAFESIRSLLSHEAPKTSFLGLLTAVLSLVVMPWLASQKRKVASEIQSASMAADARQTDFCFYLSVILLSGLACNAVFHWWWADPLAALAMVPLIVKEGINGLRGKSCADCCP